MAEIGAEEAKNQLPRLIARVQEGERIVITRYGRPVAELVPVTRRRADTIRRAIRRIREQREQLARRGVSRSKSRVEPKRAVKGD
jgi:prevent-host-death family protein